MGVLAVVQVSTMLDESQTWDEGIHLIAGYAYLRTGDYSLSPEHPPLGRAICALPLMLLDLDLPQPLTPPGIDAGYAFLYRNRLSPDVILSAARAMTIVLTILFAAYVAWWTSRRFGQPAALVALALFCFDPNLIAHGRYVTTDLIAAFTIFLTCTLWLDCLASPSTARWVMAGVALGAALGSKNSAVFLVPLVMVTGVWKREWRALAGTLAVGFVTLLAVYAPEIARLGSAGPLLPHLQRKGGAAEMLARLAALLHLPNWSYLVGIDQLLEYNTSGEPAYLLGQLGSHGWWYYFPVAVAVKTPVATLAAIAAALVLVWQRANRAAASLVVIALVFFAICVQAQITIGHRHILPVYAFLFVAAGVVLARYPKVAAALCVLVAVESVAIYPHYLSFFNRAAGGPMAGSRYLVDSNLDWGQDGKRLGRYMAEKRIPRVCLSYFGILDFVRYGIEFDPMPARAEDADCIVAASVTGLHGLYVRPEETAWLRPMKPSGRVGYSILLYDLRKRRN